MRLNEFALLTEPRHALVEFLFDIDDGGSEFFFAGHPVLGRIDGHLCTFAENLACGCVDGDDALYLVAEELDADGGLFVRGLQFDGVTVNAEPPAGEIKIVSRVLHINKAANDIVTLVPRPAFKHEDEGGVLIRRAKAVDAGRRRRR